MDVFFGGGGHNLISIGIVLFFSHADYATGRAEEGTYLVTSQVGNVLLFRQICVDGGGVGSRNFLGPKECILFDAGRLRVHVPSGQPLMSGEVGVLTWG